MLIFTLTSVREFLVVIRINLFYVFTIVCSDEKNARKLDISNVKNDEVTPSIENYFFCFVFDQLL